MMRRGWTGSHNERGRLAATSHQILVTLQIKGTTHEA